MAIRYLRGFLKKEYSVENLHFWQEIERYRVKAVEILAWARRIHDFYICEGAESQVNINRCVVSCCCAFIVSNVAWILCLTLPSFSLPFSSAMRLEIEDKAAGSLIDFSLFDTAQKEIFLMMKKDMFPRFCRSNAFQALIREKELESEGFARTIMEEHDLDELTMQGEQLAADRTAYTIVKGFGEENESAVDALASSELEKEKLRSKRKANKSSSLGTQSQIT